MGISQRDARSLECKALIASTSLSRHHGALQSALSTATYLSQIVHSCREQGVKIDVAARLESSNVLWDQQEMSASITVLRDIVYEAGLQSQDIQIGKPGLLAKLVGIMMETLNNDQHANTRLGPPDIRSTARKAGRDYYGLPSAGYQRITSANEWA